MVVDGQGGGIGGRILASLLPALPADCDVVAVGTNVLATNAMRKAGAQKCATGENAVAYNAARADVILGPVGIVLANGLLGEISPAMATAISGSDALKVLIPSTKCRIFVAGTREAPLDAYLRMAVEKVLALLQET